MSKLQKCFFFMILCLVVFCDQATKFIVQNYVKGCSIKVNSFLSFCYAENTGAAWSMCRGCSLMFAILGLVSLLILVIFRKNFITFPQKSAVALIAGGIIGNTLDRILRGYVIDFISLDLKFYHWPVFNVADGAIFIGVAILLFTFNKKAQKAC